MKYTVFYRLAILLFPIFLLSGCSKKYEGFNMIYRKDFAKAIPSGAPVILSHYFILEDIKPDFKKFADQNGKSITDVSKILPKLFRISARFGDANFGFIRDVTVNIYPHNEPNNKTEIFYRIDAPFNSGTSLDLIAGSADMKKILSDDTKTYDLEIKMIFRSTPPITIETVADFSFLAVTSE